MEQDGEAQASSWEDLNPAQRYSPHSHTTPHTHTHTYTCACACTHSRTHTHALTHTRMHSRTYMHRLTCTRTHAQAHVHIHTHHTRQTYDNTHAQVCTRTQHTCTRVRTGLASSPWLHPRTWSLHGAQALPPARGSSPGSRRRKWNCKAVMNSAPQLL